MLDAVLVVCLLLFAFAASCSAQGIQISDRSPWYWSYRGKPVLLLGGSDEDNLFNHPELMMDNFRKLEACGGNYIRGTLSCRDEGNVWPFMKVGDKYDLDKPNPEFYNRLDACCREAQRRGIIVQIEVWATFDYYQDRWDRSPWNPKNNVNYTTESTRLVLECNYHPAARRQPFFFSVPGLNNDTVLLKYQQDFVRRVLDVTLEYDNVLYCLDNETRARPEWAHYWGRFILDYARQKGKKVYVTEMWDPWDLRHPEHARTYSYPNIFAFCDVSQNNWNMGQTHYDRLIWFRNNLATKAPGGPRPMNNVKIYGMDPRMRELLPKENVARFMRNIFAGCASARFHRPPAGLGINEIAQMAIRAARKFTDSFDIFSCQPRPDLLSDREPNEAYCLANPPATFAVYFPEGGQVKLKAGAGQFRVRMMPIDRGEFTEERTAQAAQDGTIELSCPKAEYGWLVLVQRQ